MHILLSPSKTFTKKPLQTGVIITHPALHKKTDELITHLSTRSKRQLTNIIKLSEKLVELNYERYQNWESLETHPAAWSYIGETYFGFDAVTLTAEQIIYANKHVRIVSGLYGLLRITDGIRPYRLEMKNKFSGKLNNLYSFWGSDLAEQIISSKSTVVLACASDEYLKSIRPYLPSDVELIEPRFLQPGSDGKLKPRMAFAKYSRGLMARWAVDNQAQTRKQLEEFDVEGYRYDSSHSSPLQPVFIAPEGFTLKGRYKKS